MSTEEEENVSSLNIFVLFVSGVRPGVKMGTFACQETVTMNGECAPLPRWLPTQRLKSKLSLAPWLVSPV